MVDWTVRNHKQFQRERLFSDLESVKNYFTLPGNKCLDVVTGMKTGAINDTTHIHAVERAAKEYQEADSWFRSNWSGGLKFSFGELSQVNLARSFDLVFLDYKGNVGRNEIQWMESELQYHLTPTARVAITALKSFRGNKFFAHLYEAMHDKLPDLMKKDIITWRDRGKYPTNMLGYLAVYSILLKAYIFPRNVYHISAYYYGENTSSVMLFFVVDFRKGFRIFTPEEMEAQQVIRDLLCVPQQRGESIMAPTAANELVDKFLAMPKTYDRMRGFKASLTQFCEKKERETGTPAMRFRAAIKAVITRKGGDSSDL